MSLELLLLLAPAALLFAALLLGRYPGEAALERARIGAARLPRAVAAAAAAALPRRRREALLPRGGRLVGAGIAARPPPASG